MRILYVSTEVYPALKTGGLADVNAALPRALIGLGCDVRLLLPAFPALMAAAAKPRVVIEAGSLSPTVGAGTMRILQATLNGVPAYLIDAPGFYARAGNPYLDANGNDWPDNLARFALLGAVAARFADGSIDGFRPDIVHGHDWHAGLGPAYLAARGGERPASVFTVHNLAFQGAFPAETFAQLGLPPHFFSLEGLELTAPASVEFDAMPTSSTLDGFEATSFEAPPPASDAPDATPDDAPIGPPDALSSSDVEFLEIEMPPEPAPPRPLPPRPTPLSMPAVPHEPQAFTADALPELDMSDSGDVPSFGTIETVSFDEVPSAGFGDADISLDDSSGAPKLDALLPDIAELAPAAPEKEYPPLPPPPPGNTRQFFIIYQAR